MQVKKEEVRKKIIKAAVKEFKKICKKKKYDYQQKLIENLFNCKSDDPQKFWKLLKSNYLMSSFPNRGTIKSRNF